MCAVCDRVCAPPQLSAPHATYASSVYDRLLAAGLFVDLDGSSRTIPKRVRAAQVSLLSRASCALVFPCSSLLFAARLIWSTALVLSQIGFLVSCNMTSVPCPWVWRGQVEQYNLILVVGAADEAAGVVTVRARDDGMAAAVREVMLQAGLTPSEGFGVQPDKHTTVMTCDQLIAVCAALTKGFK